MQGCELTQGPSTSQSTQGLSTSETVPQTTAGPSGISRHRTNGQTTQIRLFQSNKTPKCQPSKKDRSSIC